MKRKIVALLFASILAISTIACTETEEPQQENVSETKEEEPTSLIGIWRTEENDDSYQEAIISENSIEINWVSDGGKTKSLYWSGSYSEPGEKTDSYAWTSENNKAKTDTALLASGDDTKEFSYKDGIISYEASAFGTTKTMELSKTSDEIPQQENPKPVAEETKENVSEISSSTDTVEEDASVPTEHRSALKKAKSYSDAMSMSKQGIYDQLISEYGEKFSEEAAQYAMDNLQADWNANALKKAKDYSDTMHMSKQGIYDQLISEHGEKFTTEEAQYAVDNVSADWNANALAKAKDYQDSMNMSPEAIRDQLASEYGEKFTAEEANYAISNLN